MWFKIKMMEKADLFISCVDWQNNAQKNQVSASGILFKSVRFSSKIGLKALEEKLLDSIPFVIERIFLQMQDFLPF